jgi:hypothetical protein
MTLATKRRWFRFSLRTLFVAVTVIGVWLGWQFNFVNERRAMRAWIVDHGGFVDIFTRPDTTGSLAIIHYSRLMGPDEEPEIPQWRRWLGDEAVNQVMMPAESSAADINRAKHLFPEGEVDVIEVGSGRGVF